MRRWLVHHPKAVYAAALHLAGAAVGTAFGIALRRWEENHGR